MLPNIVMILHHAAILIILFFLHLPSFMTLCVLKHRYHHVTHKP